MILGLLSDNFGADFVSFSSFLSLWMKFTITVNFLLLVLKCLRQKLNVKSYRGTPIQTLKIGFKARFTRHAITVVPNLIDRIKFDLSTTFETKSCYCRVARQALPY